MSVNDSGPFKGVNYHNLTLKEAFEEIARHVDEIEGFIITARGTDGDDASLGMGSVSPATFVHAIQTSVHAFFEGLPDASAREEAAEIICKAVKHAARHPVKVNMAEEG